MSTIDHNIDAFNQYVKDIIDSLMAWGKESTDILALLFQAYKACANSQFVKWIERKQEAYDEG